MRKRWLKALIEFKVPQMDIDEKLAAEEQKDLKAKAAQ